MDLSNDLISKFVKITNDNDNQTSKESTVYGTAVEYEGKMYVKIDGSDLLTPVETTADIQTGERVTVMVKDHSATVTGNITSPSASSTTVKKVTKDVEAMGNQITEFEIVVADKVSVKELDAEVARIDDLLVGKATIEDLEATNAEIKNLKVKDAEIEDLVADKATIKDLDAANANIGVLDAEVANIQTLVNGNLTSDNIQSLNLTSANTTIQNAMIKDAMIDTVSANKIRAGSIDTNIVTIQSTDGSMTLTGSVQQFKDENGTTRIQIGKDNSGKFTFILYDESGKGVLIDESGLQSSDAIADGLIVDAKVADGANISGSKLDIASVITEVNNDNSTTIKSNKIYLDEQGQSLEVAFNSLKSQVDTFKDITISGDLTSIVEQVQSNTTQINANKEGISTLISENIIRKEEIVNLGGEIQEVNTTLSDQYASLQQDLSGFKTTVNQTYTTKTEFGDLEIGGRNLYPNSNFADDPEYTKYGGSLAIVRENKIDEFESNYGGCLYKMQNSSVITSATYIWVILKPTINVEANTQYTISFDYICGGSFYSDSASSSKICKYSSTSASSTTTYVDINHKTLNDNVRYRHTQTFTTDSNTTYIQVEFGFRCMGDAWMIIDGVKLEKGNKATDWSPAPDDYATTAAMNSAIEQKANEITSSVGQTYATKSDLEGFDEVYATKSEITQTSNSIIAKFNESGGYNLLYNGNFKRRFEHWSSGSSRVNVVDFMDCPESNVSLQIYSGLTTTTSVYQNVSVDTSSPITLSFWILTSAGSDGTTNPYRKCQMKITYEDGSTQYTDVGEQTTFGKWEKKTYTFTPKKKVIEVMVNPYCRDTTRYLYFANMMLEIGSVATMYTPNPNEVYDGIVEMDKDGIKVYQSNYDGYTHMSADGFYVNDGNEDVISITADGLVVTGTITGSVIKSTDGSFMLDQNGNITGATLSSSKGGNFSIDENGDITAASMSVENSVSSDTIICNDILNRAYPKSLTNNVTLYVSSYGDDSSKCIDGSYFYTLQGAINSIPKSMNGYEVSIVMSKTCTENITITSLTGGKLYIYMSGYTLYGNVFMSGCTSIILWRGEERGGVSYTGTIHPSVGLNFGGATTTLGVDYCLWCGLYNIAIYGADNHASGLSGNKIGVAAELSANLYVQNCSCTNTYVAWRAYTGARIHCTSTTGMASGYAFQAYSGGTITLGNGNHAGGVTSTTSKWAGGQILYDSSSVNFASGSASTSSSTASTTKVTKTATYYASSAQAIQYYNTSSAKWRTDCVPKAGNWGYGNHTGWWFFGGDFTNISSKDISKITITFTRQRGGNSAATLHYFYTHNYTSQPSSTSPSYNTTRIASASVATNNSTTITITDSTIINQIKSAKGICTIPPSQSSTYYSVMGATMTVTFTYQE